jgi:hypothetical protein
LSDEGVVADFMAAKKIPEKKNRFIRKLDETTMKRKKVVFVVPLKIRKRWLGLDVTIFLLFLIKTKKNLLFFVLKT